VPPSPSLPPLSPPPPPHLLPLLSPSFCLTHMSTSRCRSRTTSMRATRRSRTLHSSSDCAGNLHLASKQLWCARVRYPRRCQCRQRQAQQTSAGRLGLEVLM
jgi:hypothetical protein